MVIYRLIGVVEDLIMALQQFKLSYFEHQMMTFVQTDLGCACSRLELDEGLLSQSCPARQDSLSASVKTLFLVHYASYKLVQFWPSQLVYV